MDEDRLAEPGDDIASAEAASVSSSSSSDSDYESDSSVDSAVLAANRARLEVHRAELSIMQHSGILSPTPSDLDDAPDPPSQAFWRRSRALTTTQTLVTLLRYPLHTSTMYTQYSGQKTSQSLVFLARTAPLGTLAQWAGGSHLAVAGTVLRTMLPNEATTAAGMALGVALHYCSFGVLYGAFRQSVVVRLLAAQGVRVSFADALRPVVCWARDRLLMRGPRGAVLALYLRDALGNGVQAGLAMCVTRLLTSKAAVRAYGAIGRHRLRRRPFGPADVMFGSETPPSEVLARSGELLIYTQAVASLLAAVATRLALYPVDSVLVRLMADEAGLTAHGYGGFFACAASVGVGKLYAGFVRTVVVESSLAWVAAEVAHYLCKSAWVKM